MQAQRCCAVALETPPMILVMSIVFMVQVVKADTRALVSKLSPSRVAGPVEQDVHPTRCLVVGFAPSNAMLSRVDGAPTHLQY